MAYCVEPRILGHEANVLEKVQKKQVYLKKYKKINFVNAVGRTATERERGNKNVQEEFYIICSRNHDGRNARRNSSGHHRRHGS